MKEKISAPRQYGVVKKIKDDRSYIAAGYCGYIHPPDRNRAIRPVGIRSYFFFAFSGLAFFSAAGAALPFFFTTLQPAGGQT